MASPISSTTGIGSGLNIGDIVKVLVDSDKAAKQNQITKQTKANTASLSGISQIKSALATFQSTLNTLKSTTTPAFLGFAATSADESVIKATATNSAVNGSYSIKVQNLATASKVATAALSASQASAIPSGELTISQNGTDTKINIAATSSLQQVRDQINSEMQKLGKGISANIINDANGSRLVFTSTTTGAGTDISVKGDSNIGTLLDIDGTKLMSQTGTTGNPGAGTISELAKDASFTVDGLTLTSPKNSVSNAISGLTLDLVSATATDKSVVVTVGTNTDGLKKSLQSFVDAYNTLVNLTTSLTKGTMADDGTFTAAAMTGDAMPRGIVATIRNVLASSVSTSGLASLSQLGINTKQSDGTLSLDTIKFTAALEDKKFGNQIQDLFNANGGLIERIEKSLESYTKTGGVLDQRNDALNKTKTRLTNDQSALDRRVETLTATLTKKYNAMDLVVGQLKATASNITSIFEAMNAQKNAS
ncbi:flagellar filament capping protein FliD [Pseudomonas sp. DTU_2021_1001937_2_SI_NGA_ILE_001]|uniref:flagellar filament capping protein FliD n=1 Tax=Pseudomonas sp. DTU_2021_1001937_2_SI_NGA_ILE_001 TaxID=3077589 RepID=UPI0028FC0E99|nr:flagellar filament capping protein FliD [Pseudomonas sp. DTU_2021_1001937_2_SI_NGA_ILE_001]WNW11145.1 flagellar filament capping protein FliD [Pseudomonas sp. DTU_2021_1001937_2_SI_NGA_ILE_001]